MSDEDVVRSAWENVWSYPYRGTDWGCVKLSFDGSISKDSGPLFVSSVIGYEEAWFAAAAFTRERLEEIRQLREEIDSALSDVRWFAKGEQYEDRQQEAIHRRILARLEAQLAALTAGMREAQ